MSKWDDLRTLFEAEHKERGLSVKEFCDEQGINYDTARRHIKMPRAKLKKAPETSDKNNKSKPGVKPGTQNALKHGGYTKYFKDHTNALVKATTLDDELDLCRARIHTVLEALEGINNHLEAPDIDADTAARLYESLFKAENALDRNVARVESIVKTLSSLQIDSLARGKLIAETNRIEQAAKALVHATKRGKHQAEIAEHEATKARKEAGGTSKLDDFIDKRTSGLDAVVSE